MESEACEVWTPCEGKMKKVQRKKQPKRRSMITHRKKQEIVVQKKKTKEIACGNERKHLSRFRISKPNHTISGF
jgi:hypothetical protein